MPRTKHWNLSHNATGDFETGPRDLNRAIVSDDRAKIVFASGNPGKIREVAALLQDLAFEIVPQSEFGIGPVDEDGTTFVENALKKARHAAARSGLPAIADDSGLVVDELDGRPGVRSARYAGSDATDADNNAKLLGELRGVPPERRGAGFHCAAVLVDPDVALEPLVAEGVWRGRIVEEPRGDGGFGYDPLFYDPGADKTGAEMTAAEKNRRSHRGIAFRELKARLVERLVRSERP